MLVTYFQANKEIESYNSAVGTQYSETKEKLGLSLFHFFFHLEWIQQACHNVFSSPIQQSKTIYQDEHKEEKGYYYTGSSSKTDNTNGGVWYLVFIHQYVK